MSSFATFKSFERVGIIFISDASLEFSVLVASSIISFSFDILLSSSGRVFCENISKINNYGIKQKKQNCTYFFIFKNPNFFISNQISE